MKRRKCLQGAHVALLVYLLLFRVGGQPASNPAADSASPPTTGNNSTGDAETPSSPSLQSSSNITYNIQPALSPSVSTESSPSPNNTSSISINSTGPTASTELSSNFSSPASSPEPSGRDSSTGAGTISTSAANSSTNSTAQGPAGTTDTATAGTNSTANTTQEQQGATNSSNVTSPPPSSSPAPPAQSSLVVNYSSVERAGSEISTSVLIYGLSDMEGPGYSPCEMAVNNSLGFNARKIGFVLTVFGVWGNRTVDSYHFKDLSDYRGSFLEVNSTTIARWTAGLTRCFKAGVDAGFTTLHVILHANFINAVTRKSEWRNTIKFDPTANTSSLEVPPVTYSEVLLKPAAAALNAVVNSNTTIEMALGGEQGLSVFGFPKSYVDMVAEAKTSIPNAKQVLAGVSFNYDKVCGCVEPEERDPIVYNQTYPERFQTFKQKWGFQQIDLPGVKLLLAKSDFIGLSSYAPLPAELSYETMETSIQTAAFEFLYFNIDLKHLMFVDGKSLIYSEQGLGGLTDNNRIPPNLEYIRTHPYSGTGPAYSSQLDPWQVPEYKAFRRNLYRVLTNWAAAGGGPQYRIDGIYLWSMGTWDVHAAHPLSLGRNASYGDPVIQRWIRAANYEVNEDHMDEIERMRPVVNGTRVFIRPPWVSPPPPPTSPSRSPSANGTTGTELSPAPQPLNDTASTPQPGQQDNTTANPPGAPGDSPAPGTLQNDTAAPGPESPSPAPSTATVNVTAVQEQPQVVTVTATSTTPPASPDANQQLMSGNSNTTAPPSGQSDQPAASSPEPQQSPQPQGNIPSESPTSPEPQQPPLESLAGTPGEVPATPAPSQLQPASLASPEPDQESPAASPEPPQQGGQDTSPSPAPTASPAADQPGSPASPELLHQSPAVSPEPPQQGGQDPSPSPAPTASPAAQQLGSLSSPESQQQSPTASPEPPQQGGAQASPSPAPAADQGPSASSAAAQPGTPANQDPGQQQSPAAGPEQLLQGGSESSPAPGAEQQAVASPSLVALPDAAARRLLEHHQDVGGDSAKDQPGQVAASPGAGQQQADAESQQQQIAAAANPAQPQQAQAARNAAVPYPPSANSQQGAVLTFNPLRFPTRTGAERSARKDISSRRHLLQSQ